jgi:hypothetical protein
MIMMRKGTRDPIETRNDDEDDPSFSRMVQLKILAANTKHFSQPILCLFSEQSGKTKKILKGQTRYLTVLSNILQF